MIDARRLAYLDAMGIDVWLPRSEPGPAGSADLTQPLIALGGGDGDILCIARTAEEAAQKLAADISRAMRSAPVWAWPAPDCQGGAMSLEEAVAERLLTRVLVFGDELAAFLFGPNPPGVIAAARLHVVPSLERLAGDREAKRMLWGIMREQGIAARPSSGKKGA